VFRYDLCSCLCSVYGRCVRFDGNALHAGDASVGDVQSLDTGFDQQRRALVQRKRNGGDQHGLLGIGGATHAAGAQVVAALHVAVHRTTGVIPSLVSTTEQHIVVLVGCHPQGLMLSRVSACLKYGCEGLDCCSRPGRICLCQYFSVSSGVRKELVQLTVVVPPTLRPCRDGDAFVFGFASGSLLVERGIGLGFTLLEVGARS